MHREYVLGVLRRRCRWLDASDHEALLHDAYAVFLEKERDGQLDSRAMRPFQVRAYLTQTALNKAMDEGKRAGRRRSVSLDDELLGLDPADPGREPDEQLAAQFDDARVREIVAELPERQQLVIKLRFFFNRTPQEIQRYMGITERVYRRELERATRRLAERFELVRAETFCESRRSLVLAYVTGVAGPNRMREARRHIDSCPSCASWALELRGAARRVAALVPGPLLSLPLHHTASARLTAALHGPRERAAHTFLSMRDHATRAAVRVDPSRLPAFSTARPGTVVMLVTGCLAGGSTAAYCIVHGLPAPLRTLVTAPAKPHPKHRPARHTAPAPKQAELLAPPAAHVSQPSRSELPPRPPAASPKRHSRKAHVSGTAGATGQGYSAQAARVHRATAPEFGVGGGSPISSSSSSRSSGAPPPPTPSQPLAEFDP
jgi:RNA polymerase sigma factor (sigma-70 family)